MTFKELDHILPDKNSALLFFKATEASLFIEWALPLLEKGYSVGIGTNKQLENTATPYSKTPWKGVLLLHFLLQEASILCFSSGTTNAQKGIVRTFKSWQKSFCLMANIVKNKGHLTGIVLGALPFSLSLFGVMESLYRKKRPLLSNPQQFLKGTPRGQKKRYLLWITPMHCSFIVKAFAEGRMASQLSIQFVFVGGAYFSNQQRDQLQTVFPKAAIYSFYGTSETSFISIKPPTDKSESVGTICQGVKVSIRNTKNKSLAKYTKGYIWVAGAHLFSNYIHNNLNNNSLENYFLTNDLGYVDTKNRLFFAGRASENLSICGHKIDLHALERWYKSSLNRETLALFAVPHASKENKLVLVLSARLSSVQWRNLKAKALAALGPQGTVSKWCFCPDWPQTTNGKIDRKALKKFL